MITRRDIVRFGAGLAMAGVTHFVGAEDAETYPAPGHPGHWMLVRKKQLYVDVSGPAEAPPLVYIHGGPGAGAYDFGLYQRERLSQSLRLIQFDQRGALRSEAVGADEPFTLNDLVEDTEALRVALGIKRWSVVSHSFGGLIATRYALAYPKSVEKIVFENPTFDINASDHSMMSMLAEGYRKAGMADKADEVLAAKTDPADIRGWWRAFSRAGSGLGAKRRLDLYAPSLPSGYFFDWMAKSGLSQEIWQKGSGVSQSTLWKDDRVFENLQPQLKKLTQPCLLIKGRMDANTGTDQMESFAKNVKRGRTVIFEGSGHMSHAEEPDRFSAVVRDFVLKG